MPSSPSPCINLDRIDAPATGNLTRQSLPPRFAIDVESLNSVPKWNDRGAGALPRDPLAPEDLEERDLATRIADENIAIGQGLDAGKPTDAQFRKVFSLHGSDDFVSPIHLDHGLLAADDRVPVLQSHHGKWSKRQPDLPHQFSLVAVFPGFMGGFLGHQKMTIGNLTCDSEATMTWRAEQRDGLDDFGLRVDHQQLPLAGCPDQRVAIREPLTGPNLSGRRKGKHHPFVFVTSITPLGLSCFALS